MRCDIGTPSPVRRSVRRGLAHSCASLAANLLVLACVSPLFAAQPITGEFQVNSFTPSFQNYARVAMYEDGRFIVVWSSDGPDGDAAGIVARRFGPDGTALGDEFQINSYTTGSQYFPDVAIDGSGGFTVVWESYEEEGSPKRVVGRSFDANAAPLGADFELSVAAPGSPARPRIARAGDRFVVAWNDSGAARGVRLRAFDAGFTDPEAAVDAPTESTGAAAAAGGSGAGAVVAWEGTVAPATTSEIFARPVATDGSPTGAEVGISQTPAASQHAPAIAVDSAGAFAAAWQGASASESGILARRFSSDATAVAGEFLVNAVAGAGQPTAPTLAMTPAGDLVAAWQTSGEDGSASGIAARTFPASCVAADCADDEAFQVNVYTTDAQRAPAVAVDASGRFVVVWHSRGPDGSGDGVFARLFQRETGEALCGDATGDGNLTASDALLALQTAVGAGTCLPCVCDANESGGITASDALVILQAAVGQPVTLSCPAC